MLQEEPERRYLRELPGRDGSSVEPVPFFQRRNPEAPALGRLHYDCHHNSGRSVVGIEDSYSNCRGINSHGTFMTTTMYVRVPRSVCREH